jgi:hypothetical protein
MMRHVPVAMCAVAALLASALQPSFAQGESYGTLARLPDWSGTWAMPDQARSVFLNSPQASAPYLDGYVAHSKPPVANPAQCVTTGMPAVMAVPLGFEFLFSPGRVTILAEEGPTIRRVYTDGRPHAVDPDPTYAGDSIGHWEGKTLVVDTTGIKAKSEYFRGIKTSGAAHVVERFTRTDSDHLQVDTVVTDPGALTGPWQYSFTYVRSTTDFTESYYCDGNRDGDGDPDLTPPPR